MPVSSNTQNVAINIEVAAEIPIEIQEEKGFTPDKQQQKCLALSDFIIKVKERNKKLPYSDRINFTDIEMYATKLWNNWLGHIQTVSYFTRSGSQNPLAAYLTESACDQLLANQEMFQDGIDLQHLPAGFYRIKSPWSNGRFDTIDYNEKLARHYTHRLSPVAIQFFESKHSLEEKQQVKKTIEGFDELTRKWWFHLCQQHRDSQPNDPLSHVYLLQVFQAFRSEIDKLGLKFIEFKPGEDLQNIHSMPVALGRMLTILKNTELKHEDRQLQWHYILKLNLRSSAAVRAITDLQAKTSICGFITPEMQIDPDTDYYEAKGRSLGTDLGYYESDDNHHKIYYSSGDPEAQARFWRYIAHQSQRNSIDFYRQALGKLDTLDKLHVRYKKILLAMLATSTCGDNHATTTKKSQLDDWNKLCDRLNNAKIGSRILKFLVQEGDTDFDLKYELFAQFQNMKCLPNLRFLQVMVDRCCDPFEKAWAAAVFFKKSEINRVQILAHQISDLLLVYGSEVYSGYQFDYKADEKGSTPFFDYVQLQAVLHCLFTGGSIQAWIDPLKHSGFRAMTKPRGNQLVPYLSTFNISTHVEWAIAIAHCMKKMDDTDTLKFCMDFFASVESNDSLTGEKLIIFLACLAQFDPSELLKMVKRNTGLNCEEKLIHEYCKELDECLPPVLTPYHKDRLLQLDLLQSSFAESFPDGFFDEKIAELKNPVMSLSKKRQEEIASHGFSLEQRVYIESILNCFHNPNHPAMVDKISSLVRKLGQSLDYEELTKLLENLSLVTKQFARSKNLENDIVEILSAITQQGHTIYFDQLFVHQYAESATELPTKLMLYVQEIGEWIAELPLNVSRIQLQHVLSAVLLNCPTVDANTVSTIKTIFTNINNADKLQPHLRSYFLSALKNVVPAEKYLDTLIDLSKWANYLAETFESEMPIIHALVYNLQEHPLELNVLLKKVCESAPSDTKRQLFILGVVANLLDNGKSIHKFDTFLEHIKNEDHYQIVSNWYQTPPYPDIPTVNTWLEEKGSQLEYEAFNLAPYGERKLEHAFSRDKFDLLRQQFATCEQKRLTGDVGNVLDQQLKQNKQQSTTELFERFQKVKSTPDSMLESLCIIIEMLARTTSQKDPSSGAIISQELNTAQVMALYTMLTKGSNKVTANIETGEGKSRIMMVLAAYQAALGKTVDFVTSNMQLAERDYSVYKAFFKSLHLETGLVFANSPASVYKKGGINFSSDAQLSLARNQNIVRGKGSDFIDKLENRCLLADEGDRLYFDMIQERYNFSDRAPNLEKFTWIYPLLMQFMRDNSATIQESKPTILREEFIKFAGEKITNLSHLSDLHQLEPQQINTWLQSAWVAHNMKPNVHFKLSEPDILEAIITPRGIRHTRVVKVLSEGRVVEGAKYANGVHPCLCARMNYELKTASMRVDPFYIEPENSITYSSTAKTLLSSYPDTIYAVTGTAGTKRERVEAQEKYGMSFLDVPRELSCNRQDKKPLIAKDADQQLDFIIEQIKSALHQNRPILVICENDEESQAVYAALNAAEFPLDSHLQRVHANTSSQEEKEAVARAGQSKMLTVSTKMLGRGTDIHSDNLLVLGTYLPSERDMLQFFGRAGRYGRPGEARLILNKLRLGEDFNLTYSHARELARLQAVEAEGIYQHRIIVEIFSDFRDLVEQHFFLHGKVDMDTLTIWQKYLKDMDEAWNSLCPQLADQSSPREANLANFIRVWLQRIPESKASETPNSGEIIKRATEVFQRLESDLVHEPNLPLPVQPTWDPADAGQACIYSTPFALTRAMLSGHRPLFANTRAWLDGRGILFADTRAVLSGQRPLFANLRACIARLISWLSGAFFREGAAPSSGWSKTKNAVAGITSVVGIVGITFAAMAAASVPVMVKVSAVGAALALMITHWPIVLAVGIGLSGFGLTYLLADSLFSCGSKSGGYKEPAEDKSVFSHD